MALSRFSLTALYDFQGRQGQAALQGEQLLVSVRMYNFLQRGNLAPVGPYQAVYIFGLHHQLTDLDQNFLPQRTEDLGSFYDLGIGIALGTQTILSKRLVLDISLIGNWPFGLMRVDAPEPRSYLSNLGVSRIRRFMALQVRMGIGLLLPARF